MIEETLAALLAEQKTTNELLRGLSASGVASAPAAETPAKGKTKTADKPAEKTKDKEATVTEDQIKKAVKAERDRLKDVSAEAVAKHKEESAKVLKKYGLTSFSGIPDDKIASVFADIKAINVESPKDDLDDDDLDDDDDL